jgi:hypothetical protein
MSRKRNKKKTPRNQNGRSQPTASAAKPAVVTTPASQKTLAATVGGAEAAAKNKGVALPAPGPVPKASPDELKVRLAAVIRGYEEAAAKAEEAEADALEAMSRAEEEKVRLEDVRADLSGESAELGRRGEALDARRSALEEDEKVQASTRRGLEEQQRELDEARSDLLDKEEVLRKREVDADAGFLDRRDVVFAELDEVHETLLARNRELSARLETARQEHAERLTHQEKEYRERLEQAEEDQRERLVERSDTQETAWRQRQDQLDEREEELEQREHTVRGEARKAEWSQQEADELKEEIETWIEKKAEERVHDLQARLDQAHSLADQLREHNTGLEEQLEEKRAAERALSGEGPEQIQRRLRDQQERIEHLRTELANRPCADEVQELAALREERERWSQERRTLGRDLERAKRKLATRQVAVDEAEGLKARIEAMEQSKRLLEVALDELRADVDDRLDKHHDRPVFPELKRLDEDEKLNQPSGRLYPAGSVSLDLRTFAGQLRHRIGRDPWERLEDLYYREEDIRALLGGLAMSRLHLFQGISGIGKSSLPRRFAAAVGGLCETVTVQAGWRDKQDLYGHYNAFERRFYETSFVQALAKATTPQWSDRLVIVLLDEMNLSHPEHYAADVLDVLERADERERRFELMSSRQSGEVSSFIEDGRFLRLPPNVWFAGTANHDETTKDYAPKTYDRSFVLELPGRPKFFKLKKHDPRMPLSYPKLREAFDHAIAEHEGRAVSALAWMEGSFREPMVDLFGVGWGGRLEAQLRRYVPVIVACGGSMGEALDQVIATRVLRRIRGRHDLLEEDVQQVRDLLAAQWPDQDCGPTASLRLLDQELRRL